MHFLQAPVGQISEILLQYGILGILAVVLGYFAWHTYKQIAKKNDEEYIRLVERNERLEQEVERLREDMMKLIVEERDRMANLVKANTEALNELRRTITEFIIRS